MKFNKILTINVNETQLDPSHWNVIDTISKKRAHLTKDSNEIADNLTDTDCLIVGFGVKIDKDIIDKALKLKYIGMFGTGYGNIDIEYARAKKISVTNIPGYSRESVAELVFGVILEHVRELDRARKQAQEGNYSESGFSATEIKDKVFGIIGAGQIGTRVAEIAQSFGANVKYWNRNRKEILESIGIKYEDTDKLLAKSDIVSLHLALTKETENFLNADRINSLKSGAIVVNTAPMELVDLDALEQRLAKGDIIFILDHSDEMKKEDLERLSRFENCIIYPPIGCISKEAKVNQQEIFVSNIENFLKSTPTNVVN